jgi:hypothetical protein
MSTRAKSFSSKVLPIFLTLGTVLTLTTISMLYAKGYRLNFAGQNGNTAIPSVVVDKTGILAVRSIPDAAKIYLDDELRDTTNATIAGLAPGKYNLRVEKDGFETWQKEIEVYEDLVTDITSVLVLRGGGLNPLTNTGVDTYEISNSGELLVFTSVVEEKPGLFQITLSGTPINIFQSGQKAVVLDTPAFEYSSATEIYFSPRDTEVLLKLPDENYYLVEIGKGTNQIPQIYSTPEGVFEQWEEIDAKNKQSSIETLEVPIELVDLASSSSAVWSPDGEKFMVVTKDFEDKEDYTIEVYNFEDPIPVGEERFYKSVHFSGDNTNAYWYSDSKHIVLVTENTVELVAVDGSNRTNLFNGQVIGSKAVPTPAGDKIIILTKIKEDAPTNLYMISIR